MTNMRSAGPLGRVLLIIYLKSLGQPLSNSISITFFSFVVFLPLQPLHLAYHNRWEFADGDEANNDLKDNDDGGINDADGGVIYNNDADDVDGDANDSNLLLGGMISPLPSHSPHTAWLCCTIPGPI